MTLSSTATTSARRDRKGDENRGFVPEPSEGFVATPETERVSNRALAYLRNGYPVHLAGPPGTGKTTLALHLAALRGRRAVIMHGNPDLDSSDFVGSNQGYRKSKVVDNFIHSVVKKEEEMRTVWSDHRLATACRRGYTLIYDEFNRSNPETNNILLSVFEEGLLSSLGGPGNGAIEVHPEFRAIFTSNPAESVGTHETQDALRDRLVTVHLDVPDREAEVSIVEARTEAPREAAECIVETVRLLRERSDGESWPTIRASVVLSDVFANEPQARRDAIFVREVCHDVLTPSGLGGAQRREWKEAVDAALRKTLGDPDTSGDKHAGGYPNLRDAFDDDPTLESTEHTP